MIIEWKGYEIDKAKDLAMCLHYGQEYGDKDYMYHVIEVIKKTQQLFISSQTNYTRLSIVAALHDTIEDTEYTYEQCLEDFDATIAGSVRAISKREGQSHEDYIKAVKQDYYAHKVKIADTLCNLEASITSQEKKRIKKYTQQLLDLTL